MTSYKQSKLANVLFSRELARRMKGEQLWVLLLLPCVWRSDPPSGGGAPQWIQGVLGLILL